MLKLSVIIPSWKDPYHEKTVQALLDSSELGDQLEIISIFDGYWPSWELVSDPRRKIIHLGKNRGMRGAINAGVEVARGEFLMRTAGHPRKFGLDASRSCYQDISSGIVVRVSSAAAGNQ